MLFTLPRVSSQKEFLLYLLFGQISTFFSYFLLLFLLLQSFRKKTTILLNKYLNSAQILRIYLHICLWLLGAAPPDLFAVCKKPDKSVIFYSYLVQKFKLGRFNTINFEKWYQNVKCTSICSILSIYDDHYDLYKIFPENDMVVMVR